MTKTEADNKELIRGFRTDVYEGQNPERIDEYVAEDVVSHSPILPEPNRGRKKYREFIEMLLTAFPDYDDTTEDLIAEDDKVAVRIHMTGTHKGPFMDLEPTGNTVEISGMIIYRIEDGQIVEDWHQADMLGMMQQLGAVPKPSAEGSDEPYLLAGDEGTPIWSFGVLMNLKATGEDTGGAFALVDHLADPGVESPYHVHHNEEELFYVLDGEIECYFGEGGEERVHAGPGDTVYLAREIPHGFRVVGDESCRMLVLVAPAGLEELWIEAGEPAPELTTPPPPEEPPDLDALAPLAEQYGIEFLGPIPR